MRIEVFQTKEKLARAAALQAAHVIRQRIHDHDSAFVIVATGVSQFEFLDVLTTQQDVDWSKTSFFHLDEYIGLSETHPASFRKYLKERIVDRIHPREFYFIRGDYFDPSKECQRVGKLISQQIIDVAFVGIGENGHLAFNDPPADFETEAPFLVVELDERCRRQQLREGWFPSLDAVPTQAISMSVRQILKARKILCIVPEERKAEAVRVCLEEEVSPNFPASILRHHDDTTMFLDEGSKSLLSTSFREELVGRD